MEIIHSVDLHRLRRDLIEFLECIVIDDVSLVPLFKDALELINVTHWMSGVALASEYGLELLRKSVGSCLVVIRHYSKWRLVRLYDKYNKTPVHYIGEFKRSKTVDIYEGALNGKKSVKERGNENENYS